MEGCLHCPLRSLHVHFSTRRRDPTLLELPFGRGSEAAEAPSIALDSFFSIGDESFIRMDTIAWKPRFSRTTEHPICPDYVTSLDCSNVICCSLASVSLTRSPLFTVIPPQSIKMAAINALIARDSVVHQLAKRNWASREPGVITVFCIVFVGMARLSCLTP